MIPTPKEIDADPDLDEDGELDVNQFPLPAALLKAAGIDSDEEWDDLGTSPPHDGDETE